MGLKQKASDEGYTFDPNLILFCVYAALNQLPLNYLCPLSFYSLSPPTSFPPLSFTSTATTFRWFNGNYSEMERNEKSRVHWLFVKSYLFTSEKAWKQLGHTFLNFAERPFVIKAV